MNIKIPKRFKAMWAWYYRNIVFGDRVYNISFDDYKPDLFEIVQSGNGARTIYLGNGKILSLMKKEVIY